MWQRSEDGDSFPGDCNTLLTTRLLSFGDNAYLQSSDFVETSSTWGNAIPLNPTPSVPWVNSVPCYFDVVSVLVALSPSFSKQALVHLSPLALVATRLGALASFWTICSY